MRSLPNPLTEARQAVTAALEAIGVHVYGAPPEQVTPPAVIIKPGDPWHGVLTYAKTQVNLDLTLLAQQAGSTSAALERMEQLAWDVRTALTAIGIVGTTSEVRQQTFGQAQLAAADLSVTLHVTDD